MPTIIVSFSVEVSDKARPSFANSVFVQNAAVLDELVALGLEYQTRRLPGRIGERINVSLQEDDVRLRKVFTILEKQGLQPYPRFGVPPDKRDVFFAVRRQRSYQRKEIVVSELLSPHPFTVYPVLATWIDSIDGRWQIAVDKRQKNLGELGQLDIGSGLVSTKEFVLALQDAGFAEARWDELHYDNPAKVIKKLGMLSSSIVMPPCLTRRQNGDDYDWLEGDEKIPRTASCQWDDGGYVPEELKFDGALVEQLGKFNLAITREQTGNHPGLYCHTLIVSQRFREFVEQRKVRGAQFVPVKLV